MTSAPRELDLQPHPRILPMLGEIHLPQWRCLAELIDNSVDGFIEARRQGKATAGPHVAITVPMQNRPGAVVSVRDNGPGMDASVLEMAVKAGWTSHDPIGNLGLFGMGFNIATARLGTVTRVWTTRCGDAEWFGVEIDFDKLIAKRSFRTPLVTRPKAAATDSGTEVCIEKLKPDQLEWFAKPSNRAGLIRDLTKTYSAMLRPDGTPISFRLDLGTQTLVGRKHCVWGGLESPPREVITTRYGAVEAYQKIDKSLPNRLYCTRCWAWVGARENECPSCEKADALVPRERRVHGWLGVQRYLSENEYGIDLLRNGRKIEVANQDLFYWSDGDTREEEYPIDDPRHRGRLVGEVHIDHCRVNYTKDRFDRNDPAWEEMTSIVRGDGPLRPDKAAALGKPENRSPLFLLFQAFRRSSPKPKGPGAYARLLIVPDNDRAEDMAKRFHAGDVTYQSDHKWMELVEEADRELLRGPGGAPPDLVPGLGGPAPTAPGAVPPAPAPAPPPPPVRRSIPSLTREFREQLTEKRFPVRSFEGDANDIELCGNGAPWSLKSTVGAEFLFIVNPAHPAFRSATLTPLDALLVELAVKAADFARGGLVTPPSLSLILAGLRNEYAQANALAPEGLAVEANATLNAIARGVRRHLDPKDSLALYAQLTPQEQDAIQTRMATRQVPNAQAVIAEGRFLEYAPRRTLTRFFETHPELFLDGKYWDDAYAAIQFQLPAATEEARLQVVRHYSELLSDAIWLSEKEPEDLALSSRARLLRAALSLDLLEPASSGAAES